MADLFEILLRRTRNEPKLYAWLKAARARGAHLERDERGLVLVAGDVVDGLVVDVYADRLLSLLGELAVA